MNTQGGNDLYEMAPPANESMVSIQHRSTSSQSSQSNNNSEVPIAGYVENMQSSFDDPTKVYKAWKLPSNSGSSIISPIEEEQVSIFSSSVFAPSSSSPYPNKRQCLLVAECEDVKRKRTDVSMDDFDDENVQDKIINEAYIDENESDLMEIKSTLASAIYKNAHEESRLGPAKNISPDRIAEMKMLYGEYKVKSDRMKNIARKELYQLHKLIRARHSLQKDLEIAGLMTTNITASVVLSYINHLIRKEQNIAVLCNSKILLLKHIVDLHPVKRPIVALLLGYVTYI